MKLILLAALLAGCGGGIDAPGCALPSDQSAFSMACQTSVFVDRGSVVTVEITGKVSSNGTFSRYVQASIGGDGYQGTYLDRSGSFHITQTVTSETFGGPKRVDIGLSSIETLPGASSRLDDVSVTVTQR